MASDLAVLARYDDGSEVVLSSYSGGAHKAGAWGHIALVFRDPAGGEQVRTYTADGPAHDWGVQHEPRKNADM